MTKAFFIGGLILMIAWAIGFFGYHISGIIHVLPATVILAFLVLFLYRRFFADILEP